jgi:uncharacterized MAPEG superfamily protein
MPKSRIAVCCGLATGLAGIWPSVASATDAAAIVPVVAGTELSCLLAATLLFLILAQIYANAGMMTAGIPAAMGNREDFPTLTGWIGRAKRAHLNLLENLLPFGIVVLLVQVLGVSSWISQTGAVIFLAARAVHAGVYIAGIPGLRSLAFVAGVAGTFMVALPVIQVLL